MAAFRLGISAESRAALFLIAKAYRIVARRWKTPFGEIDIVARRRNDLVFFEVKARDTLDDAAEAVTERSKKRIVAAAGLYMGVEITPDKHGQPRRIPIKPIQQRAHLRQSPNAIGGAFKMHSAGNEANFTERGDGGNHHPITDPSLAAPIGAPGVAVAVAIVVCTLLPFPYRRGIER